MIVKGWTINRRRDVKNSVGGCWTINGFSVFNAVRSRKKMFIVVAQSWGAGNFTMRVIGTVKPLWRESIFIYEIGMIWKLKSITVITVLSSLQENVKCLLKWRLFDWHVTRLKNYLFINDIFRYFDTMLFNLTFYLFQQILIRWPHC